MSSKGTITKSFFPNNQLLYMDKHNSFIVSEIHLHLPYCNLNTYSTHLGP